MLIAMRIQFGYHFLPNALLLFHPSYKHCLLELSLLQLHVVDGDCRKLYFDCFRGLPAEKRKVFCLIPEIVLFGKDLLI